MRKEDARDRILHEMRKLLPELPYEGSDGGMIAFQRLADERPDLLMFRASGDKWQVIHGWMLQAGIVAR